MPVAETWPVMSTLLACAPRVYGIHTPSSTKHCEIIVFAAVKRGCLAVWTEEGKWRPPTEYICDIKIGEKGSQRSVSDRIVKPVEKNTLGHT